ncbi:beta-fructofuranosidase [Quercus suber]|uniref:Beta-fructofuranosidase n=1 Tax=Quercus suber TaxID=58331 RepID=A0AAW0K3E5_QUESU
MASAGEESHKFQGSSHLAYGEFPNYEAVPNTHPIQEVRPSVKASHKIYPKFQSLSAVEVKQIHRTGFHFQPPKHWMNGNFFSYSLKKL